MLSDRHGSDPTWRDHIIHELRLVIAGCRQEIEGAHDLNKGAALNAAVAKIEAAIRLIL